MNTSSNEDRQFLELADLFNAAREIVNGLQQLKSSIPVSDQWHFHRMVSSLRLLMDGVIIGKRLFVDSWPSYTCVILSREYDALTDETEIFCLNNEESKTLSYKIIDNFIKSSVKPRHRLITLPGYLHFMLDKFRDRYAIEVEVICRNHLRFDLTVQQERFLDDRVVCKPLTEDHLSSILSHWEYSKSDSTPVWLRDILRLSRYNIGLFDDDVLVAHVLKGRQGTMSMLYVDPPYRGRNYGRYLLQKFSRFCLENNEPVILETDSSYEANKTFFDHFGFDVVSQSGYFILTKIEK